MKRFFALVLGAVFTMSLIGCNDAVVLPKESEQSVQSSMPSQTQVSSGREDSVDTNSSSVQSEAPRQMVTVTIPEGFRFIQIAERLEANGICSVQDFYEAAQNYQVQSFYVPYNPECAYKFEGYLFPATYQFYVDDDPVDVLVKMLNAYAAYSGMPDEKTLILASIIQQEARSYEHMQLVSSVYHNRLNNGEYSYLGADPTRVYVNECITPYSSLLGDTSVYAALFNTNGKRVDLPAGPICNPGSEAIQAARNPASTDYYYFFFGLDDQNHYSRTAQEHDEQIEQYGVGNPQ